MSRDFLIELNSLFEDSKIKISPVGESVVGRDGRVFEINGLEVIEAAKRSGIDLMLDIDHYGGEAVGWFSLDSLEVREDGIYASLELTKRGKELVENKAYRYLSPAFVADFRGDIRVVKELHSIGLVNQPNLLKKSLNSKEDLQTKKEIEALKEKLAELEEQKKALQEEYQKQKEEYENKLSSIKVKNALDANTMLAKREEEALRLRGEALDSFLSMCALEAKNVFKESDLKNLQKNTKDAQVQKIAQSLGLENLD